MTAYTAKIDTAITDKITKWSKGVTIELQNYLQRPINRFDILNQAIRYSVLDNNSKRIRSLLFIEMIKLLGYEQYSHSTSESRIAKNNTTLVNIVLAIEMLHDYSLIHDDLPTMDNSDIRRGKNTCHKEYSEAIALLAGNALFAEAFAIISNNDSNAANSRNNIPHNITNLELNYDIALDSGMLLRIINILANAFGSRRGIMYGQFLDVAFNTNSLTHREQYTTTMQYDDEISSLMADINIKTTEFFVAIAKIANIIIPTQKDKILVDYAENFGLLFQLADDIKDNDNNNMTQCSSIDDIADVLQKIILAFGNNPHTMLFQFLPKYIIKHK